MVSDWSAMAENSVGDNRIRLEKHIIVRKIRKNILGCLYWSVVPIFVSPLGSFKVRIPVSSI